MQDETQKLPDEFRKLLGVEEKQEQRRMDSKRIWKARENQKRYWLCILPQSGHWSPLAICSKISAGTIDDPTPVAASLQGWALSYQLLYGFPAKLFWVLFQIIYLAHGWGGTLNDILRSTHIHLWLGFCELATFPPALYWCSLYPQVRGVFQSSGNCGNKTFSLSRYATDTRQNTDRSIAFPLVLF